MSPRAAPWIAAAIATVAACAYALTIRLPLPFDGFAAVAAAGLAILLTLAIGLAMPADWLWTDAERLRHAFRSRHGLSEARAGDALAAITTTHARAAALRRAARDFADSLRIRAESVADRLDTIARAVFYEPETLSAHRKVLVRAELIEEAVAAHAALRRRGGGDATAGHVSESRARVAAALDALDAAFDASDARAADRLLTRVDAASATAEQLLAPRRAVSAERTTHDA